MIDSDLAELYRVETKYLNKTLNRNKEIIIESIKTFK
jgi:hypothetical protein